MKFSEAPTGSRIFIDANVFIYVFADDALFAKPCADFLERVETGSIEGVASANTLTEVAHRLMTLEACESFGWPYVGIGRRLRKHPDEMCKLYRFREALDIIISGGTKVVSISASSVLRAAQLSVQHGLLNNDALVLAIMEEDNITQVASSDTDFDRVPGITRYGPV